MTGRMKVMVKTPTVYDLPRSKESTAKMDQSSVHSEYVSFSNMTGDILPTMRVGEATRTASTQMEIMTAFV